MSSDADEYVLSDTDSGRLGSIAEEYLKVLANQYGWEVIISADQRSYHLHQTGNRIITVLVDSEGFIKAWGQDAKIFQGATGLSAAIRKEVVND